MNTQWLSRTEESFWPQRFKRHICIIVNTARDRRIFEMSRELHLEYRLYSGPLPPALAAAAPYLVQFAYDDRDTQRFLRHPWDNSLGVFLKCGAHANALTRHVRGFLVVRDPDGNRLLFRYFHPCVLRIYLPTCTHDELDKFFGFIERFWTEDGEPGTVLDYSFDQRGVVERKFSLS